MTAKQRHMPEMLCRGLCGDPRQQQARNLGTAKVEVWELSASGFPFGAIAMPACDPRPGPRCPVSTCGRGTAQVDVGASGVFCLHWSSARANVKPNAAALQIWRLFMNDNCGNNLKSTPMH